MRNFNVTVDGKIYQVSVEEVGESDAMQAVPVQVQQATAPVQAAPISISGTKVTSPMPGMVVDFKVASGSKVKKGQVIVILEAMKMQNDIAASADGVVSFVVQKGATVNAGDVLATINQ